jgi:hypothetical protein
MDIIKHGFYLIKDDFFRDFPDPFLVKNKEGKRPHYYCFKDDSEIIWVIPITSKKDKIDKVIDEKKKKGQKYEDLFHFLKIGHKEGILLIVNMFPITKEYIEREYTISGKPFKLLDTSKTSKIDKKAKKILALLRKGVKFTPTQTDVLKMESDLKSKLND